MLSGMLFRSRSDQRKGAPHDPRTTPPRPLRGVLIAESLRVGSELSGVPLQVTSIQRIAVGDATADQPRHWTLLHFRAPEDAAGQLAEALASCLAPTGGWYVSAPLEAG
ncbi:hypothetical protein ACFPH6_21090 [Streptomyces xiangluensis]|uniref:Uncharacterized protein n=1 Tax=Streptomyces xiangluensis TaxID=2665720 RepID=A0ABV8YQJ6_9ACTN